MTRTEYDSRRLEFSARGMDLPQTKIPPLAVFAIRRYHQYLDEPDPLPGYRVRRRPPRRRAEPFTDTELRALFNACRSPKDR